MSKFVYIPIKPTKLKVLKKRLKLQIRNDSMKSLDLSVYYCLKCNRIHKKMVKNIGSKVFFNHWNLRESNRKLSNSKLFKIDFKMKWKQEAKRYLNYKKNTEALEKWSMEMK